MSRHGTMCICNCHLEHGLHNPDDSCPGCCRECDCGPSSSPDDEIAELQGAGQWVCPLCRDPSAWCGCDRVALISHFAAEIRTLRACLRKTANLAGDSAGIGRSLEVLWDAASAENQRLSELLEKVATRLPCYCGDNGCCENCDFTRRIREALDE